MAEPYFSVVIPTYNRAAFIPAAIRSVLNQTFTDFEVVVVDDGSTDNTEDVVKPLMLDPRLRYFRKANAERAAARNFGVTVSRGQYINFLDSDDTQYANHLQTAYDFIQRTQADVLHLGYDVKTPEGRIIRRVFHIASINQSILLGNVLSCNGVVAKKEVLRQHPFNENRGLSSLEDWELWIRLGAYYTLHHVDAITSTVVNHENRSVMAGRADAIEEKVKRLIQFATEDPANRRYYGRKLRRTVASAHTYAALHLRMAGAPRSISQKHLWLGLSAWPGILFTKRTVVIMFMLSGIR